MPKILCHLIKVSTLISNLRFLASFRRLEESTHCQMKLNRCSYFHKLWKKHKNPIFYSFFNKVYPKSHLDWPFTLLWGQISYSKMNHISIISIEWINWARYVTFLDTIFIWFSEKVASVTSIKVNSKLIPQTSTTTDSYENNVLM